jgi:hypothetical protein
MKQAIFISILIPIFSNLFSQNSFVDGFIVENSGDTLYCRINSAPIRDLQKEVTFIHETILGFDTLSFKPFEIKEMCMYHVGTFRSKRITYRTASNIMMSSDYHAKDEEKFTYDTVFLKVLVYGRANLYLYRDDRLNEHYFIEKDTVIFELYEKEEYKYVKNPANGRDIDRVLTVQKKYLGILSFIFKDNPKITKIILQKLKCSKESFMKITNEYNKYFKIPSGMNSNEMIKSNFGF